MLAAPHSRSGLREGGPPSDCAALGLSERLGSSTRSKGVTFAFRNGVKVAVVNSHASVTPTHVHLKEARVVAEPAVRRGSTRRQSRLLR
jgi:hypothetical protein